MATPAQRCHAIADALLNAAATPAQINRLGVALASGDAGGIGYATMTQAEKAAYIVRRVRGILLGIVLQYEQQTAITEATTATKASVTAAFPEAP